MKIIEMCLHFVENRGQLKPQFQEGEESFYRKRSEKDDEIDPNKSIVEQFNHFRIADTQNYPLYFWHRGVKYFIKIFSETDINHKI